MRVDALAAGRRRAGRQVGASGLVAEDGFAVQHDEAVIAGTGAEVSRIPAAQSSTKYAFCAFRATHDFATAFAGGKARLFSVKQ